MQNEYDPHYGAVMAGQAGLKETCDIRQPSLRQNLEAELVRAKANVTRLAELLALLDRNPEINRIMELLGGNKY